MSKIVVALGGNALGKTPEEQLELVKNTAKSIVELIKDGNKVVIAHGNGPQVGIINLAFDYAASNNTGVPVMPFAECGAMSQGYIGYHLSQAIECELKNNNIEKNCIAVVTQVLVDKSDKAFLNPTKPVGMFYSKEEAIALEKEKGYTLKEDAGRGYRRVVASPKPVDIVEINAVKELVNNGNIVITVGGGGIPVIDDNGIKGVDAVIDKDFASAKLAELLNADILLILTAVDSVYLNYKKEDEKELRDVTVSELKKYIEEGHFAKGSMLPKVEACMEFINNNNNGVAVITSLDKALLALKGKTGTRITK